MRDKIFHYDVNYIIHFMNLLHLYDPLKMNMNLLTKKNSGVYTPNVAKAVLSKIMWNGFAFNVVKSK